MGNGKRRVFAVGYFNPIKTKETATVSRDFIKVTEKYLDALCEVYFPWPGIVNARGFTGDMGEMREQLTDDLRWCRDHGLALDLLINGTCYGEKTATTGMHSEIVAALRDLDSLGLMPDIVTTTLPFVGRVLKMDFPKIEVRASVNMRLTSTLALDYIAPLFDSFYIGRDVQRDFPTLKLFRKWADGHGKKLCMLANSGCLRNCPGQTMHETILSHDVMPFDEGRRLNFSPIFCDNIYGAGKYEEFLRATWIRPEDIELFTPYASVFKLSTRKVHDPEPILKAYASGDYDGDLAKIVDPRPFFPFFSVDNKSFPSDWAESGVAGICAVNCTHCGRCGEVLRRVFKRK
ncbi:MAG: hypothetical protein PHI85_02445 [Victivallaceae bacterium]|nr:hypothetical protein [Victivallaceae bacterium]